MWKKEGGSRLAGEPIDMRRALPLGPHAARLYPDHATRFAKKSPDSVFAFDLLYIFCHFGSNAEKISTFF